MAIPKRPTTPTSTTGLHWQTTDDGSRTLWSEVLDETYHSGCGAVAESLVVYLLNSGVHARFLEGNGSAVLEYGFGTGTAFLLTAADALRHNAPLRYRALEISLLPAEILGELKLNAGSFHPNYQSDFGALLDVAQSLLLEMVQWRSALANPLSTGVYQCTFRKKIELEVVVQNAENYETSELFDAVYFDPFSPESCPELWKPTVFRNVFNCLQVGGTITSYCVKGSVQRDLRSAGFEVRRVPGPIGGKREVLIATKPRQTA